MLLFYICSIFTLNNESIIFIGIYLLMVMNNRKNICDLVFGILALILSFGHLFFEYNLLGMT